MPSRFSSSSERSFSCSIKRRSLKRLYHITSKEEAGAAKQAGFYEPRAFAREGFIHCSYAHQVSSVANRIFKGRDDLVLFEIDQGLLDCRIVDENLEGGSELYPHIYDRLPMSAVVGILEFPCDEDGRFRF